MIKTEDCYIVLTADKLEPAEEYTDYLFDSVEEAEDYIEKNGDDVNDYDIVSLIDFISDMEY
jgi:hypothetical protein